MKVSLCIFLAVMSLLLVSEAASAFESDEGGRVKFTVDSLSFFQDQDKDGSAGGSYSSDREDDEYTYDAMGRKVPAKTLRSGDADPIR